MASRLDYRLLLPALLFAAPVCARAQAAAPGPTHGEGSGTSWIPAAVALPGRDWTTGGWSMMLHGLATAQWDRQDGRRGNSQLGSINWGMIMGGHPLAGGQLTLRGMASLDVLGVTPRGYPLLLQSGESYNGQPLHDRQHPHDVLMEAGALYDRPLAGPVSVEFYAAPVGEPALGPTAFMHRPSAMDNPTAPIGHHWQDATHISYGVVTAGVFTPRWKIEGSAFNGREPDQNRWNIDPVRLDSYAGRVSYAPTAEWTASASYGFLASPDALHPQQSQHRITGSLMRSIALGNGGTWASTAIWGANAYSGVSGLASSLLVESEAVLGSRNSVFGRAEFVQKNSDDLALDPAALGVSATHLFPVAAVSAGYVREFANWTHATLGLGAMATVNFVPVGLERSYGSRTPVGFLVFFRLRPLASAMAGMQMHGMMPGGMMPNAR
ncbi:MAG: hypothetical protein KGN74_14300 [Gemmatimonadota bacterium]|nr:hypothetical protein [Gemmatimonadota bacterium]